MKHLKTYKSKPEYCTSCGSLLILVNGKLQCNKCLGEYNYKTKLNAGDDGDPNVRNTSEQKSFDHINEYGNKTYDQINKLKQRVEKLKTQYKNLINIGKNINP